MTTKLTLLEIQNLSHELNGYRDSQNGELLIKGLLNEKTKLTFRYWLTNLNNILKPEIQILDDLKNELIKKYGDKDEKGNILIQPQIDNKINQKYLDFQNEYLSLLNEEKDINHHEFKLEDLEGLEIDYNTPIFFKLINNE